MQLISKKFSILITTKNRLEDLVYTLQKMQYLIDRTDVECVICDDGSNDGTAKYVKENYPQIQLLQNEVSKGLIYSRNRLLNLTKADYAISLDDDAHFITEQPLESIAAYFDQNPKVGLLGLRVFWSKEKPSATTSTEHPFRMKSFVGCGHVWRMNAWRSIPNYPEWFIFYGEEDFASYQLFKRNWEIHYLPQVLVHHRVDLKSRRGKKDFIQRQRRSFRSSWYLYFMFYPWRVIPKKLAYTLWIQFKDKTLKGDWKATYGILLALMDVLWQLPKSLYQSNRLTYKEYRIFLALSSTEIYWSPKK